jgi:enoyl-CoA hydratase/carnithine racemase
VAETLHFDGPDTDGVATLAFSSGRPANIMNLALVEALSRQLTQAATLDAMRVLLVRGAPSAFSGGADLRSMADLDADGYRHYIEAEFDLFDLMEDLPFLTVAVLEGPCLGNGAELALACDLRIAAASTRFGFPETRIGFQGPVLRLSRYVGLGHAKRLLYGGEIMAGHEAADLGLISWVVPDDEVWQRASRLAAELALLPRVALRETKQNLAAVQHNRSELRANEIASSLKTFGTEDATEGRAAFLDKRVAVFRGR